MMEPTKKRRCAIYTLLAVVCVVTTVSGISAWVIIHGSIRPINYIVVLDAGSSHTALYVYKWSDQTSSNILLSHRFGRRIEQTAAKYCERRGLASYDDYSEIPGKLESCLEYAMTQVPTNLAPSTEVHVGGTAGLRLLRSDNVTAAESVLEAVRDGIRNYSSFQLIPNNVRIISGEEEGFYGWATANYLAGTFSAKSMFSESDEGKSTSSKAPYGFLQLGGASAQIAFTPPNPQHEFSNDSSKYRVPADIFGEDVQLYSQSFLCHGLNEAWRTYRAMLIAEQNMTIVMDPCLPSGGHVKANDSHLFGHHYCSIEFNTTLRGEFVFMGLGDYQECNRAVFRLLKKTGCSDPDLECSLNGMRRPVIKGQFLAFSGYYSIIKVYLHLAKKKITKNSVNLTHFRDVTRYHCSKHFDQMKEDLKKENASTKLLVHMTGFCFHSIYIDTILTSGYGFNETTFTDIEFLKHVEGTEFGWPLGLALQVTLSNTKTIRSNQTLSLSEHRRNIQ